MKINIDDEFLRRDKNFKAIISGKYDETLVIDIYTHGLEYVQELVVPEIMFSKLVREGMWKYVGNRKQTERLH